MHATEEREKKNREELKNREPTNHILHIHMHKKVHTPTVTLKMTEKKTFVIPHLKQNKMFLNYFFLSRWQAYKWSSELCFKYKKKHTENERGKIIFTVHMYSHSYAVLLCIVYIIYLFRANHCAYRRV